MSQAERSPEPPSPGAWRELVLLSGLGIAGLAGLVWFVAGGDEAAERRASRVVAAPAGGVAAQLVGDRACGECHPGEAAHHARSGHAQTLTAVADSRIARELDGRTIADPERPGVTFAYRLEDGRLRVARGESGTVVSSATLDYAFGSDTHATTFVGLATTGTPPVGFEHRLTHFAGDDNFGITPGQEWDASANDRDGDGRRLNGLRTLQCFACHATLTSASGTATLDLATMIPTVSCESCHGPGADHVAAAREVGRTVPLTMPFGPQRYKAEAQMRLCGQCHRHPDQAPPGSIRPDNAEIVRFQPVGLMQSACYMQSNGVFHCATCHDPHTKAENASNAYEAVCLRCHDRGAAGRTSCPVSPAADCVSCHMPKRNSGQGPIGFTDHWIRRPDGP